MCVVIVGRQWSDQILITLFSLIDFSLPQIVLNEILFFFFSIGGNYPTMRAQYHSVLGGMVFMKYWVSTTSLQLPAFEYNRRTWIHIHMWSGPVAPFKQPLIYFNKDLLIHPHVHHQHCRRMQTDRQSHTSEAVNGCFVLSYIISLDDCTEHHFYRCVFHGSRLEKSHRYKTQSPNVSVLKTMF